MDSLGFEVIDGFTVHAPTPIDKRFVKQNRAALEAVPLSERYVGLFVWLIDENKRVEFKGGTGNGNITDVNSGGVVVPEVINRVVPSVNGQTAFDVSAMGVIKRVYVNGLLQDAVFDYGVAAGTLTFLGTEYALDTNDLITIITG